MGASLIMFVLYVIFCKETIAEEQHCSKYHYEAQTLERIIKAEINVNDLKNEVQVMKNGIKAESNRNAEAIEKLEEKVQQMQENFQKFTANMTSLHKAGIGTTKTDSMRQFCTSNETCTDVENSQCQFMSCKCKPGLSYHQGLKKCVSDCGKKGYGDTYQIEKDTYLNGYSAKHFTSVSAEDCVKLCTKNTDFVCRTAEYWNPSNLCNLSWETLHTDPEASRVHKDSDLYTRDCELTLTL